MQESNTYNLTKHWGNWLGKTKWDYFSTITYKFDINSKRNENIMLEIEKKIQSKMKNYKVFWIMEQTGNKYQTHNHLLIKGNGVKDEIITHLKKKNLINDKFIKHIKYDKQLGANYYVCKYIKSKNIRYGISYSDNYKLK